MPSTNSSYESDWQPARLLSTIGLRGEDERERRATSALLAVMMAVPEFGQSIISQFGAPKGQIATFTEIQLKDANGRKQIPDGAIVVSRGKKKWCALVEVKTGHAPLKPEQVESYLDLARANEFDALITISNEITAERSDRVVQVDKRKLRTVNLFHISWWRILTAAIIQHRFRGVSDPDQAWILGELIHYLDNDKSGASGFAGMGEDWVSVRDSAGHGTLRASDKGAREVAERWDRYTDYLALCLSQDLGANVLPVRSRKSTTDERCSEALKSMVDEGLLRAGFKIPDAVGPLEVSADLRTKRVTTSVAIDAPREGRALTRINWLLRQLKDAPSEARVDVRFANTKETSSQLLMAARDEPAQLLFASDTKRDPRSFQIALSKKMGLKRGVDAGSFARETRRQTAAFYRDVVQSLQAWQAPAPRLEANEKKEPVTEVPDSALPARDETAFPTSQWSSFFTIG